MGHSIEFWFLIGAIAFYGVGCVLALLIARCFCEIEKQQEMYHGSKVLQHIPQMDAARLVVALRSATQTIIHMGRQLGQCPAGDDPAGYPRTGPQGVRLLQRPKLVV
jgi:hypothetical protein